MVCARNPHRTLPPRTRQVYLRPDLGTTGFTASSQLTRRLGPATWFLSVESWLWLRLLSDPASRRRPCLRLTVPVPWTVEDFHLREQAHARHTKKKNAAGESTPAAFCAHYLWYRGPASIRRHRDFQSHVTGSWTSRAVHPRHESSIQDRLNSSEFASIGVSFGVNFSPLRSDAPERRGDQKGAAVDFTPPRFSEGRRRPHAMRRGGNELPPALISIATIRTMDFTLPVTCRTVHSMLRTRWPKATRTP